MIINFISWSPLISFIAIALLYPLKNHVRSFYVTRIYATALLLPALVSGFCCTKLTLFDKTVITKLSQISMTPIFWGSQLTATNSIINLSVILSLTFLTIFLPQKYYTENVSLLSVYMGAISLISSSADHLVKLAILSIAATATVYCAQESKHEGQSAKDFLLQRLADFVGFFALVILLSNQTNLLSFNFVYSTEPAILILLFSLLSKILLVIYAPVDQTGATNSFKQYRSVRWLTLAIGSSLIISDLQDKTTINISIIFISLIAIAFTLNTIINKKINEILTPFIAIFALVNIYASTALISTTILIYPYMFLKQKHVETLHKKTPSVFTNKLIRLFQTIPNFLTATYSGFLLYRLPQIIMGILQTPLRLSHNGNMQRSLMLTAILLISFILWWKK